MHRYMCVLRPSTNESAIFISPCLALLIPFIPSYLLFSSIDLHTTSPYTLPPLSPSLLLRRRGTHELLQSDFGGVLFGIVDVLAVVPEARIDDLIAFDRDSGGPGSTSASAVGDDVEDWRMLLGAAAVVCTVLV